MLSEFFRYKGHLVIISITAVRAQAWRWGYCIDRGGYWYCEQTFDGPARHAQDEARRNAQFDIDRLAVTQGWLDAPAGRDTLAEAARGCAAGADAADQWG